MPRGLIPRQPAKSGRHEGPSRPTGRIAQLASRPKSGKRAERVFVQPGLKLDASSKENPAKAKRYNPVAPERVQEILKRLDQTYPGVTCALQHTNAWELLVATILSAQCTDVRVNMVTPVIFKKYPTPKDFAALKPEELEPDIRTTGFFRNKAKSVVGAAKKIIEQ